MFQNILFPTDTSDASNAGFKYALNLMNKYNGRMTILTVHEEFMNQDEMQYLRISPNDYSEFMKKRALQSRSVIEKMVHNSGVEDRITVLLREGNPRKTILGVAEEIEADIIVMSSQGRSNLKEHLIGSVAEYVVRNSHHPVLVIKAQER